MCAGGGGLCGRRERERERGRGRRKERGEGGGGKEVGWWGVGGGRGEEEVGRKREERGVEGVLSGVLATLVVVEGPSTCQDSHLTGKRGASQGRLAAGSNR